MNRNKRLLGGELSRISHARSTWARVDVGDVTPNTGSQWLSANIPGSTDPIGLRLLKNPTPPTHTVWYPTEASPLTRSGLSNTHVSGVVVSLPPNRPANSLG